MGPMSRDMLRSIHHNMPREISASTLNRKPANSGQVMGSISAAEPASVGEGNCHVATAY